MEYGGLVVNWQVFGSGGLKVRGQTYSCNSCVIHTMLLTQAVCQLGLLYGSCGSNSASCGPPLACKHTRSTLPDPCSCVPRGTQ